MIRLFLTILAITLAAAGAIWFADRPGRVAIDWLGLHAETSVASLALIVTIVFLVGSLLTRGIIALRRDIPFSAEKRERRRRMAGYRALNGALLAIAAGDRVRAASLTRRALGRLPDEPLTRIMAAEAARLAENRTEARRHYEALAAGSEARFLGLRGLIEEARAAGEREEARKLAADALALEPASRWAAATLHALDLLAADWNAALVSLEAARRTGALEAEAVRRRRAALLYCKAIDSELAGDRDALLAGLRQCLDLRPGFAPALLRLARSGETDRRELMKRLMQGWKAAPDPALAELILEQLASLPPDRRLREIRRFVAMHPDHRESRILLATGLVETGERGQAHEAIAALAPDDDRRLLLLLARLRRADGDRAEAERLTTRAAALSLPHWICSGCGTQRALWTPLCPSCERFDSFGREGPDPRGPGTGRIAGPGTAGLIAQAGGGDDMAG